MLTMLIVDDEYWVRMGIRETIHWESHGFQIIGEAGNGREGLAAAAALTPDIIITDIRMPLMDGVEFMAELRAVGIDSRIIVLSGYEEFDYARSAIRFGASAYLLKPIENQQLVETVLSVGGSIQEARKAKQHYDELKEELPAIQKQFILDLLAGSGGAETALRAKWNRLELPLSFENPMVLVLKPVDLRLLTRQFSREQLEAFGATLQERFAAVFFGPWGFRGMVLDKNNEEIIGIVQADHYEEMPIATVKAACRELLAQLSQSLGMEYPLTIGIGGPAPDLTGLSGAYQEALTACEHRGLPGLSRVYWAKDDGVGDCHPLVKAAVAYLRQHLEREITVELVARELFVSPSHLMHLFKAELGKTFNDCLVEYRIERAKELLRENSYKIYEVCAKVGYNDTKYFSQLFKKVTGFSPSEYGKITS
jgi:two-component system response regulator YesN